MNETILQFMPRFQIMIMLLSKVGGNSTVGFNLHPPYLDEVRSILLSLKLCKVSKI